VGPGQQALIERRWIGPVIRELRRTTDPLFRQAGISRDGKGREELTQGAEG
jgi:hypothetical protein